MHPIAGVVRIVTARLNEFLNKRDPLQKRKWEKLHMRGYHPSVEEIVRRINETREKRAWLSDALSDIVQMRIDFKDKVIVEIGCGGGWYLAETIYPRCRQSNWI